MRLILTIIVVVFLVAVDFNLILGSFDSNFKLGQVQQENLKISQLQNQNQSLKNELQQKESPFYLEKEARDLLSYGKPGETAVVVQGGGLEATQNPKKMQKLSNWQRWWNLLFS